MKPDIPSPPCPALTAAKACFSSHKRCTIERLSLSLFPPSFFYFSPVLVLPVGKARCQPLPKAGQSALTLYANASPQGPLTHSFCAPHHHLPRHSFIYFCHLLLWRSFFLSYTFSLSCTPVLSLHFNHPSLCFLLLHPFASNSCLCSFYLNCYPSSSITHSATPRSFHCGTPSPLLFSWPLTHTA